MLLNHIGTKDGKSIILPDCRTRRNIFLCEYCNNLKSLFWCDVMEDHVIREIYIELDGSITVETNVIDLKQAENDRKWGWYHTQKDSCNVKIKYCPMCGRKLEQ